MIAETLRRFVASGSHFPAYFLARRVSVHVETSVKTAARRNRDFHASIRHHRPQPGATRQNTVAPIRGIGIKVPADATGCNLNPALISTNRNAYAIKLSSLLLFIFFGSGGFAFVGASHRSLALCPLAADG